MSAALQLDESAAGPIIPIRAIPRAGRSAIAGLRNGMLLVRLQSAPAEGAANTELLGLLAKALGVGRRDLEILSGELGRTKRIRVTGLSRTAILERLATLI